MTDEVVPFWKSQPEAFAAVTATAPMELAAAHFLASYNALPGTELPQTTGHVGAPVDRRDSPYPVVLYSPGVKPTAPWTTGWWKIWSVTAT